MTDTLDTPPMPPLTLMLSPSRPVPMFKPNVTAPVVLTAAQARELWALHAAGGHQAYARRDSLQLRSELLRDGLLEWTERGGYAPTAAGRAWIAANPDDGGRDAR